MAKEAEPIEQIERKYCEFPGCKRAPSAKGHCATHYAQLRRGVPLKPIHERGNVEICKGPNCKRRARAKNLCATHYGQYLRGKQLTYIQPRISGKSGPKLSRLPLLERIDASTKRDDSTGCLLWIRAKNKAGSGVLNIDGRTTVINNVAYNLWFKANIGSKHVHKACGEPACIEPAHLYVKGVTKGWKDLDKPKYTAHEMQAPEGEGWVLARSINGLDVSRTEPMSRADAEAAHRVFVGAADKATPTRKEMRTWLKYLTLTRQGGGIKVHTQPLR